MENVDCCATVNIYGFSKINFDVAIGVDWSEI